jgi:hypothetical protein
MANQRIKRLHTPSREPLLLGHSSSHSYSQVGNLENTTSLLSLFYAGFIGIAVVLITDY